MSRPGLSGLRRAALALAAFCAAAGESPSARAERLSAVESAVELASRPDGAEEASFLLVLADADWPTPMPEPSCLGLLGPSGERHEREGPSLLLEPVSGNPRVARLRVRFKPSAASAAGTYLLTASIQVPTAPEARGPAMASTRASAQGFERERLTLTLKLAAAALGELPRLALDPWHTFLPSKVDAVPFALPLVETGGRASFAPSVQLISAAGPGEAPLRGSIQCPESSERLAAGRALELACSARAEGGFPVGTTKLRLLVGGARLSSPSIASVEVKRRLPGVLIVVLIAAGLAAGYLVRVLLSAALRRREQLAAGWAALAELDIQRQLHEDPEFGGKLLDLRAQLVAKVEEAEGESLFASAALEALRLQVEAARAPLAAALGALEQKRADIAAQLDSARRRVAGRWMLPGPLAAELTEANAALAGAQQQLQRGKLDEARAAMEKAVAFLDQRVGDAAQQYPQQIRARLDELAPVPEPLAAQARQGAAAVRQALGAIQRNGLAAAPDLLSQLTAANAAISDLLTDLRAGMARIVQGAADALEGKRPREELRRWEERAAGTLGSWPRAPWDEALAEAPAVLARFRAAMKELAAEPQERLAAGLAVNAATPVGGLRAEAQKSPGRASPRPFIDAMGAPSPAPTSLPPIAYPQLRVRAAQQSAWRLKLLQLAVLGVLATATGYSLVADRFVGTPAEVAGIFGWAFAIDLSTDAMVTLVKSLWRGAASAG